MKKCPVVHFEMPASDKNRVKKFYSEVFGWTMQQMGPEMGNYIMAHTLETSPDGMPAAPGAINGGFWETKEKDYPHLVISVDDVIKHIEIVKKAGGKILGEVMPIPGVGDFVMIEDSEGNKVGLLEPLQK